MQQEEARKESVARTDYWLAAGIVVKVMNKTLQARANPSPNQVTLLRMDAALHACPRLALLPVLLNPPHGGGGGVGGGGGGGGGGGPPPTASHGALRWPAAFENTVARTFNKSQQAAIAIQLLSFPPP